MRFLTILLIITGFIITDANSQIAIKIEDVSKHLGDSVKICTKIYGGRYLFRLKERPTYLDVGADYPNHPLTIFIANKDRENFEDRPEMMYAYRDVCITGKLEPGKGRPQMIITKPGQIVLKQ